MQLEKLCLETTSFANAYCQGRERALSEVQIKNIKLHIVTDIKVTFNSMFGFRISIFGWGEGPFHFTEKSYAKIQPIIKVPLYNTVHACVHDCMHARLRACTFWHFFS